MILNKVSLQNFMPYFGKHEVRFASDAQKMVTLIIGDNMRGKTSLLNAVRWCLYGTALDRARNQIALYKLVNRDAWQGGERTFGVSLQFSFEGCAYDLRRTCTFPPSAPPNPRDAVAQLQAFLLKDGSAVSADQIERLIARCAPEQTSRFFLFDAELLSEYEELVSVSQGQGERIRKEIENQLGIPVIKDGIAYFKNLRADHVKRADKAVATNEIHRTQQLEHRRQQEIVERATLDCEKLRDEKHKCDTELSRINSRLADNEDAARLLLHLQTEKLRLKSLKEERGDAIDRRKEIVPNLWRDVIYLACEPIVTEYERAERERLSLKVEQQTIARLRTNIQQSIEKKSCFVCGQNLSTEIAHTLGKLTRELSEKVEAQASEESNQSEMTSAVNQLRTIRANGSIERLKDAEEQLSRKIVEIHRIDSYIEEIERQLGEIDQSEIESLGRRRLELTRQLGSIENALQAANAKLQVESIDLEKRWKILVKMTPASGTEVKEANICEAMLDLLSSCQDSYRENLKVKIESLASEAFGNLSTEKQFTGLKINENYGLTILDSANREVSLRSAGAEQIVALSLIDALSKTTSRRAPIVIDTPFARLDLMHRENVLRYLPKMAPQVVLFVHEGEYAPTESTPITAHIGRRYRIDRLSDSRSELTLL